MDDHNKNLSEDEFDSAVRSTANLFIQNDIWLTGCGCCGSVEAKNIVFDNFTVSRAADGRWEVSASARSWGDGNPVKEFSLKYTV